MSGTNSIAVGSEVIRVNSGKSVDGSKGTVRQVEADWAKVYWHTPSHSGMAPKHTKVSYRFLQVVEADAVAVEPAPAVETAVEAPAVAPEAPAKVKKPRVKKPAPVAVVALPEAPVATLPVEAPAPVAAEPEAAPATAKPLSTRAVTVLTLLASSPGGLTRKAMIEQTGMAKGWSKLLGAATKGAPAGLEGAGLVKSVKPEGSLSLVYTITDAGRVAITG